MQLLNLAIRLALLVLTGFFIRKIGVVDGTFHKQLSNFLMNVCLPCLIVNSMNVDFSRQELINCAIVVVAALITMAVLFIVGHIGYLVFGKSVFGRVLRHGTIFPNFTFFGMPVAESLYGTQGLFYFTILTLPVRMFYYSTADLLLSGKRPNRTVKEQLKNFFSAPVVAVFVGLFFFITQIKLPTPVAQAVSTMSSITSPLGMVLCGLILGDVELKTLFKKPSIFVLTLFKNIVGPAAVLGVLLLLPINDLIVRVAVVYAAAPVASLLSMFTLKSTGGDTVAAAEASANTFMSTMLAVATMPMWAIILDAVLG